LPRIDPLKAAVFAVATCPAAALALDYWSGALATPWRMIVQETGLWSMRFLVLGLCISPLVALTGLGVLHGLRRMIGLFGAFYAAVHLFAWTRQYGFDWPFLADEIVLRRYLTIGLVATLLLVPLVATSTSSARRWLGERRWRRLHGLVYAMTLAAFVHSVMARGVTRLEVALDAALLLGAFGWRLSRRTPAER
jgi:sulfoxide reductase heme-binding subunit YedZ